MILLADIEGRSQTIQSVNSCSSLPAYISKALFSCGVANYSFQSMEICLLAYHMLLIKNSMRSIYL